MKFLPSPNFHSLNTTAFGFTAQAAVSAADADVRGTLQSTLITVNSINDVPTVVPPGLPDQTLVIGGNITIVLPDTFTDLDGDKLTYSVLTNSDSSKASAVITGSELTLQGLDNGFIEITVLANDGLGGTVTESFNLRVGTAALTTFQPIKKNIKAKRKDGLFHISVRVTNTTPLPVSGIRLHVDFSKYRAKHPTLRLENASSPSKINNVYLDYIGPVAVDESVVLKLEFYTRNRKFPKIFSPDYRVETLDDLIEPPMELAAHFIYPSASTASSIVPTLPLSGSRPAVMEGGSVQLTFPVIVGRWYCVSYSSDFKTWTDCPTPVQATSTTLHWTDSGPPSTDSHPAGEPSRFYRIHEVTAP